MQISKIHRSAEVSAAEWRVVLAFSCFHEKNTTHPAGQRTRIGVSQFWGQKSKVQTEADWVSGEASLLRCTQLPPRQGLPWPVTAQREARGRAEERGRGGGWRGRDRRGGERERLTGTCRGSDCVTFIRTLITSSQDPTAHSHVNLTTS